ncbi:hypothetical protein B7O95_00930 [Streptococcus dysgalactiae subsp. equisimilis]|nr:hypothetical protein SDE12394_02685 [Streptococcus dysgalactiae subsp. equisimilis ATCC 12394]ORJ91791.1 hypothetical protein B7O95_00930 [Streptococcus dysgalactiae subsp. equisimilis]
MTSEKLAPVKKLPSQATFKFCFQLTVVIASSLIGHHLLSKIPLTIIPQFSHRQAKSRLTKLSRKRKAFLRPNRTRPLRKLLRHFAV